MMTLSNDNENDFFLRNQQINLIKRVNNSINSRKIRTGKYSGSDSLEININQLLKVYIVIVRQIYS